MTEQRTLSLGKMEVGSSSQMERAQCAVNDLSRQQPHLYRTLGFPPLPKGCLKSPSLPATASLSSWHVRVNPLAWRIRWVCPLGEPGLSMGSLPTHHRPNPPHLLPTGRQPRVENVGEIPSLSPYLSQFQEHKDVPIDVHHHLSGFHQPSHRVLLCDTHSQAWAEEPWEWTGPCLPPPPQQGPTAGQRGVPID